MAEFDESARRLTLKLVYYGPAQSGKTTNLMRLHDMLVPQFKGEIMVLDTHNDRTLFFDLLPLGFTAPSGLLIKFKVFTVPGQVVHDSTRKAILSRADAVAFIADSQSNQRINNAESFQNLEENVARVGLDLATLPVVVQFNKRDLKEIIPEEELIERWSAAPWPLFFSSALNGEGVAETFASLLEQLYRRIADDYALASVHGLSEAAFIQGVMASLQPLPGQAGGARE